jgi:hypothetical protein
MRTAGLQDNCCAADSLLCGRTAAAAGDVLMASCCLQASAERVPLHAGHTVCQSCCCRTFAELALHQCCCCCQSLCGVLELAESFQLDHLWTGRKRGKQQQCISSRAAAAAAALLGRGTHALWPAAAHAGLCADNQTHLLGSIHALKVLGKVLQQAEVWADQ